MAKPQMIRDWAKQVLSGTETGRFTTPGGSAMGWPAGEIRILAASTLPILDQQRRALSWLLKEKRRGS